MADPEPEPEREPPEPWVLVTGGAGAFFRVTASAPAHGS